MKKFIQGMYQKKNFGVRLTAVILSVIVMGFALSLLVLVDLGTYRIWNTCQYVFSWIFTAVFFLGMG